MDGAGSFTLLRCQIYTNLKYYLKLDISVFNFYQSKITAQPSKINGTQKLWRHYHKDSFFICFIVASVLLWWVSFLMVQSMMYSSEEWQHLKRRLFQNKKGTKTIHEPIMQFSVKKHQKASELILLYYHNSLVSDSDCLKHAPQLWLKSLLFKK